MRGNLLSSDDGKWHMLTSLDIRWNLTKDERYWHKFIYSAQNGHVWETRELLPQPNQQPKTTQNNFVGVVLLSVKEHI